MQNSHFLRDVRHWLHKAQNQIALLWLLGLLLGALAVYSAGSFLFFRMRPENYTGVSIVSLASTAILPFLIAAYASGAGLVRLLPPMCFLRAFFFSFSGCFLYSAYGSAGWLIRLLLQFSDICTMPLLIWFCLRCCSRQGSCRRELLICLALTLLFVCVSAFVVSPILAEIL